MEKENHAFTRSKWDVAEQQLSSFRAAQDNVFNFHTRLQQLQVRTESDRGLFFVSVCFVLICFVLLSGCTVLCVLPLFWDSWDELNLIWVSFAARTGGQCALDSTAGLNVRVSRVRTRHIP